MNDRSISDTKKPTRARKFWYIFIWLILWPLIVLIPALVTFAIGWAVGYYAFGLADEPKSLIFMIELAILIGTILLAVSLMLIKLFLIRRKHLFFRTGGYVIGGYVWIGILIAGTAMAAVTQNTDAITPPASQDQAIMAILSSAGGRPELMKNVSLMYVDGYADNRQAGEYQPILTSDGEFSYGTITIKRGQDPEYERTVVAHEYIHHVWEAHLDDQTKHQLTSQLIAQYGKDTWMQNRGQWHADKNMLEPTELFAFYCTEISDTFVSTPILDQCSKYINRSTLKMIR